MKIGVGVEGPSDLQFWSKVLPKHFRAWQFDIRKDPQLLDHPSLSHCLEVLLIASLVCTVLAALLCWQREFHVKTPEKSG